MADLWNIPARLAWYFQVCGTLSVLAWMLVTAALAVFAARAGGMYLRCAAVVLCGVAVLLAYILAGPLGPIVWAAMLPAVRALWRRVTRTKLCVGAVGLALVGVVLAAISSAEVSAIQEDRTRQLRDARERQERLRAGKIKAAESSTADIHFAEDTRRDQMDLAGKTDAEIALLTATQPADGEPEYKRRGKQARDSAATTGTGDFAEIAPDAAAAATPARMMPAWDVIRANRLDRVNLFAVRYGLLLALLMLAADYVRRFNSTFGAMLPAPLSGAVVDALAPKSYVVRVEDAAGASPAAYLATAVRKGESFIYFGPGDPMTGEAATLRRLPLGLCPVRTMASNEGETFPDADFIFESAWFGRYCFVVKGERHSRERLAGVLEHLRLRWTARARARRTVNLLWHFDSAPDDLPELAWLCREANFRLLVWSSKPAPTEEGDVFDEIAQSQQPD